MSASQHGGNRSSLDRIVDEITVRYALFRDPKYGTELDPSEIRQIINDGLLAAGYKLAIRLIDDCQADPEGKHRWRPLGEYQNCQACGEVSEPLHHPGRGQSDG